MPSARCDSTSSLLIYITNTTTLLGLFHKPNPSPLLPDLDDRQRPRRPQQQHPRLCPESPFLAVTHCLPHPLQLQLHLPLHHYQLRQRSVVRDGRLGCVPRHLTKAFT